MKCRVILASVAAAIAASFAAATHAAPYPEKPLKLIVPTPPGVPPDIVGRLLAEKLSGALGQPVVVENRPGAIGTIGIGALARSAPDGYAIGLLSLPQAIAPHLLAHVPYDTEKDVAAVTLLTWSYPALAVRADSPLKSVSDLLALAKSQPGAVKFSSAGNGTPPHLAGALLNQAAGVSTLHIPYKGAPASLAALLAGEVQFSIAAQAALSPHLRAGKVRALATMAPRRLEKYPDIPAIAELGYPQVTLTDWQGLVVPAGTPREVVSHLHSRVTRVLAAAEVRQRLEALGLEAAGLPPEKFSVQMREDIRKWGKVIGEAGIRPD